MNQEYWDQFARTGRVEDYLSYREKEVCKAKTEKYGRLQKGRDDRTVRLQGLVHLVISENSCCMKEEIPTLSSRQRSKIILQSSARMWKRHTMHFIFSNLQIFIQGKPMTSGKC